MSHDAAWVETRELMEHVIKPEQKSEPLSGFTGGTEWMVDASGCDRSALVDLQLVRSICDRVVADLGLSVVGDPVCHVFPGPGGVTALYLLSESHLACHTYPEHAFATFNLYCCRRRPAWPWRDELTRCLGSRDVVVRELHRDVRTEAMEAIR
ncbi:MAG: S-adenosylmethionine decarboxylase [Planctomycetales bacterium]|nr:S-adenosylmethionine decarboxylase [Planctomycetales bacterium]